MGKEYTDAQKKATIRYLKDKTDSIQIRAEKGTKERWRTEASARGKSLNRFIVDAVEAEIKAGQFKFGMREYPFYYHGMTMDEWLAERQYMADHLDDVLAGEYKPMWKQRQEGDNDTVES